MSNVIKADYGSWEVECLPEDGARISSLKYKGYELLTTAPSSFTSPREDYGEFETRPVYGYDDCFPSCDECIYPELDFKCRDHGQLCWENWDVTQTNNGILCSIEIKEPSVRFTRSLKFTDDSVVWNFEVSNRTTKPLPFLHIMHPLMRLKEIINMELPGFVSIVDENKNVNLPLTSPSGVNIYLKLIKQGDFRMLLMEEIKEGRACITFKNGMILEIGFDPELFPTFGIWWNNSAYPNEDGIRRNECAFEPIPGTSSNLATSFNDGSFLMVEPEKTFDWKVKWEVR